MRVYQKGLQQTQDSGAKPRMCNTGRETLRSLKPTPTQSSHAEASKHRQVPGRCSGRSMAEVKVSDVSPGVSSRKGKETSVTFEVVSFMVFAGTWPTTARGLFTKVIPQHHPEKHL